jgi:hypothetical protein
LKPGGVELPPVNHPIVVRVDRVKVHDVMDSTVLVMRMMIWRRRMLLLLVVVVVVLLGNSGYWRGEFFFQDG